MLASRSSQKGQTLIFVIILILIAGSSLLAGGFSKKKIPQGGIAAQGSIVETPGATKQSNLQINSFSFGTPPNPTSRPSTNSVCNHDNGQPAQVDNDGQPVANPTCTCNAWLVICREKKCAGLLKSRGISQDDPTCSKSLLEPEEFDLWCKNPSMTSGDATYCLGKPVIYLYPEKTTSVDVKVETPGKIVVSDPHYQQGVGWLDVEAHPDGTLVYKNQTYKELFYESEVTNFLKPQTGIVFASSNLKERLSSVIYQLGLNGPESKEFLDFWVPKLEALKSPYIFFSVIDAQAKEAIDHVYINPEPQTRIEFIAYFKPLDIPFSIGALKLPPRPERSGFTSVEWGGTIDTSSTKIILR